MISNAIRVENINHKQVGHISRRIAARLAPLMDRNQITIEGEMHEGNSLSSKLLFLLKFTS